MAYQKQTWENLPSQSTPITAERLNHMEDGIEGAWEHGGGGGGDALKIGAIIPFSGTTAPNGYMICDGSAISRTTYAELFSVIGTTYGVGDGSTTFNIPNLKGKTIIGLDGEDTDFNTLGNTGGEKTHTLTVSEIPAHNHSYDASDINNFVKIEASTAYGRSANINRNTGNTGGGQPHNNLQPYVVTNYIIKVTEAQTGEVLSESLPVGSEIDFDGTTQDIPAGWEEVDGPEIYSTEEKVIGIYIGNNNVKHTLYEKTFIGSAATNTNIATNWTYPIIDASVVVSKDGTGDYVCGYASASINCGIYGSFTSGNMKIYHGLSGSVNYRVTIKYIKD